MDVQKLKAQIIEVLNLEELSLEDFDADAPLFADEGIGLYVLFNYIYVYA